MKDENLNDMTCYEIHARSKTLCGKTTCKFHIATAHKYGNCTLNAALEPRTLEEVGNLLSLSRMRVCKIEKYVREKCRDLLTNFHNI